MPAPPVGKALQWLGVDVVELVSPLPSRPHQSSRLKHLKVLRDGLPGGGKLMLHDEPRTDLEQGLPVAFCQFVENHAARGIRKRLEDVTHPPIIGK